MNAWLVRPYPHMEKRLTEFQANNLVAIGWPALGDLHGKSKKDIKECLAGAPYQLASLELGNAHATVDIFVNRMQIGDLVLVPDGENIYFGCIESAYTWVACAVPDGYPHQRRVRWLQSIKREELSKPLRSSLKVHRTTADLSRHAEEIDALAHGRSYEKTEKAQPTLTLSYPLRSDFMLTLEIPQDITRTEAQRLAQYLGSLYFSE